MDCQKHRLGSPKTRSKSVQLQDLGGSFHCSEPPFLHWYDGHRAHGMKLWEVLSEVMTEKAFT